MQVEDVLLEHFEAALAAAGFGVEDVDAGQPGGYGKSARVGAGKTVRLADLASMVGLSYLGCIDFPGSRDPPGTDRSLRRILYDCTAPRFPRRQPVNPANTASTDAR